MHLALSPRDIPINIKPGRRGIDIQDNPARPPAAIDLALSFKYDSAELEPDALIQHRALGIALKSDKLLASEIKITGFTDAKGGDDYNLQLSRRRAEAVKNVLTSIFDIAPERLSAAGMGKPQPRIQQIPKQRSTVGWKSKT